MFAFLAGLFSSAPKGSDQWIQTANELSLRKGRFAGITDEDAHLLGLFVKLDLLKYQELRDLLEWMQEEHGAHRDFSAADFFRELKEDPDGCRQRMLMRDQYALVAEYLEKKTGDFSYRPANVVRWNRRNSVIMRLGREHGLL